MPAKLISKLKTLLRPVGNSAVVEIYSKPGCHLCDDAKAVLQHLQRRHRFTLREVNIAADEKLLAEYGARIPLVFVNGHLVCKYFVDEAAVARSLVMTPRSGKL